MAYYLNGANFELMRCYMAHGLIHAKFSRIELIN